MNLKELSNNLSKLVPTLSYYYDGVNNFDATLWIMIIPFSYLYTLFWSNYFSALVFISLWDLHVILYKKHIDASVKERTQTLPVPSEEICMRILCNKHIKHHLLFQTDKLWLCVEKMPFVNSTLFSNLFTMFLVYHDLKQK